MKFNFYKKIYPWRNLLALFFTVSLVAACLVLISRSDYRISQQAIRKSEIFRRYAETFPPEEEQLLALQIFNSDFERVYSSLYVPNQPTTDNHLGVRFGDGDIVGVHTGGRSRAPDGSGIKGRDNRRWFDAKFPLTQSQRLSLYGATGIGLGDKSPDTKTETSLSREHLSVGGGFGFSYRLSNNIELLFDYRHSRPLDTSSLYHQGDAAGFTLHFSF